MSAILNLEITKDFLSKLDENAYVLLNDWTKFGEVKNDEKLAEVTNQKITAVRSTLNKLSFRGIVKYEKEKDQQSGWYNFYWGVDFKKLASLIYQERIERFDKLKDKQKQLEEHDYFVCKNNCTEFPFEVAAEYNFACPQCNQTLEHIDKTSHKEKIELEINQIEKDLGFIQNFYFPK